MLETSTKAGEMKAVGVNVPNGAAMAAILSAALGVFVIGVATVLASASPSIKNLLNWWNPAGPLSGKTGVGVIAWIMTWGVLHLLWRGKEIRFRPVWIVSVILLIGGLLLTFPPIFEAFENH